MVTSSYQTTGQRPASTVRALAERLPPPHHGRRLPAVREFAVPTGLANRGEAAERVPQDGELLGAIAGLAEHGAAREAHADPAGRADACRRGRVVGHRHRRDAARLDLTLDQSAGLVADGSDG